MTPKEFLYQLNPNSKVFDLSVDYKYTEEQLVLFAKLYHESELKKLRVTDVSGSNSTLYSVCCNEEPNHRKKGDVEYYECPYCKEECEVEWIEDEFPDYCH